MTDLNEFEKKCKSDEINITITYKKDDMRCSICLNYLSKKIYRCTNGPHYVCSICNESCDKCPVCKSGILVRSIEIEDSLKKFLIKCPNDGCPDNIFQWDNEHSEICIYSPIKCNFCNNLIKCSPYQKFFTHFTEYCSRIFTMTTINIKKSKFKFIMGINKSNIIQVISSNGIYIIMIFPDNKSNCYKICIFSNDENQISKKIKCNITNNNNNNSSLLSITSIKSLTFESIPFSLDESYIFEDIALTKQIKKSENSEFNSFNRTNVYEPIYNQNGDNQNGDNIDGDNFFGLSHSDLMDVFPMIIFDTIFL